MLIFITVTIQAFDFAKILLAGHLQKRLWREKVSMSLDSRHGSSPWILAEIIRPLQPYTTIIIKSYIYIYSYWIILIHTHWIVSYHIIYIIFQYSQYSQYSQYIIIYKLYNLSESQRFSSLHLWISFALKHSQLQFGTGHAPRAADQHNGENRDT